MTTPRTTWPAQIAVVLVLLAADTASGASGFLAANSLLGENAAEAGFRRATAALNGEPHRGCGELKPQDAAELFVAPQGKTWQDFLPEAQRRLDATKVKYPGMENATGMAISRAKAPERLEGLTPRVEEHLAKIAQNPGHSSIPHWSHEVSNWLNQMEAMLPHVGKKTAADWATKINQWRQALPPKP